MSAFFAAFAAFDDPLGFMAGDIGLDAFLDETRLPSQLDSELFVQNVIRGVTQPLDWSLDETLSKGDRPAVDANLSVGFSRGRRLTTPDVNALIDRIIRSPSPSSTKTVGPVEYIVIDDDEDDQVEPQVAETVDLQAPQGSSSVAYIVIDDDENPQAQRVEPQQNDTVTVQAPQASSPAECIVIDDNEPAQAQRVEPPQAEIVILAASQGPSGSKDKEVLSDQQANISDKGTVESPSCHGAQQSAAPDVQTSTSGDNQPLSACTEGPSDKLESTKSQANDALSDNPKDPERPRLDEQAPVGTSAPPSTPRKRGGPRKSAIQSVPATPSTPRRSLRNLPPSIRQQNGGTPIKMEVDTPGPGDALPSISVVKSRKKTVRIETMNIDRDDDELPSLSVATSSTSSHLSVPATPSTPRRSPRNHPASTPYTPSGGRSAPQKMDVDADSDDERAPVSAGKGMTKAIKLEKIDTDASSLHLNVPATPVTPRRSPRSHPGSTPYTPRQARGAPQNMDVDANDKRAPASARKGMTKAVKLEKMDDDDTLPSQAPTATQAQHDRPRRASKRIAMTAPKAARRDERQSRAKRVRSGPRAKSVIVGRFISGGRWKCCIRGCDFVTTDAMKRGAHKRGHVMARAKARCS